MNYVCSSCDEEYNKWVGQCTNCKSWNTVIRDVFEKKKVSKASKPLAMSKIVKTADIKKNKTNINEFDRVLGGGLVEGMACLLGGEPGIGKSTILSQIAINFCAYGKVLYVSGEESLSQISLRIERLGLFSENLFILPTNSLESIFEAILTEKFVLIIVDSIQTISSIDINGAPGSVSQVRHCSIQLINLLKEKNISLFIIGHVTKDGSIAGPRVLEHMVDTVLYFQNEISNRFRLLKVYKNRFGPTGELGVFSMQSKGLVSVKNPSAIFLSQFEYNKPGTAIASIWHGTRPLLIEIQALAEIDKNNNKIISVGYDTNRLAMLVAVIEKYTKIKISNVFLNVVGGIKVNETSIDLAVCFAIVSSINNTVLKNKTIFMGEVGLAGEIRPVAYGQERIKEAKKIGFESIVLHEKNLNKLDKNDESFITIKSIAELIKLS
jgi:DNA repair protein RadA/Sms